MNKDLHLHTSVYINLVLNAIVSFLYIRYQNNPQLILRLTDGKKNVIHHRYLYMLIKETVLVFSRVNTRVYRYKTSSA